LKGRYRQGEVGTGSTESGNGAEAGTAVAVLLACAAIAAALVGGRAALLGDAGADALNDAVREDVRQGARVVGDVRRLYEEDAVVVHRVAEAALLSRELELAAQDESGAPRLVLDAEAAAQEGLAELLVGTSRIARGRVGAAVDVTGADLLERLAAIRAQRSEELEALDPDATQSRAEEDARASALMLATTVPIALAFLLGALAEALPGPRRRLLVGGYALVISGVIAALLVEVLGP
jgi:hypothetical protein